MQNQLNYFYQQASNQHPIQQPPHSQQQPPPALFPPNHSPFQSAQDLRVDNASGPPLAVPGPSVGVGLPDTSLQDSLSGAGDDDDDEVSDTLSTPGLQGYKKKGGRPRDRVWLLFEGDREVARCRFCQWKTDHPKAFRMRTHVAACDLIPQDQKDELARHHEKKEQQRLVKAEQAEAAAAKSPAGSSSGAKKVKRDHDGNIILTAAPVKYVGSSSLFRCHASMYAYSGEGGRTVAALSLLS
ncbi:hypothetical protein JCM11641_000449 [Rhodosporidiobolus odoratus]